ncbi:MAG: phytanoyl-CoA dioxygenase family protein [Pseudomonadota bacterium]
MYTKQAIRALGATEAHLSDEQKTSLEQDGYYLIEGALSEADCQPMRDAFETLSDAENGRGGHEVHIEPGARRVSNIFNKTDAFDKCLEIPEVLAGTHHLLGEFKVHGANLRDPDQGSGQQALHTDVPKKFADDWWVMNAVVVLDEITLENGPTRVLPGSHRWQPLNVSAVNMGDWEPPDALSGEEQARVPSDLEATHPDEVLVTAPAGSVMMMNSSLWHSGTRKNDASPRRVLHLTYTRRDLPQQLTQIDYLTPELYERMSPEHRFLLEIEPVGQQGVVRQPKRETSDWWS